MDYLFLRKSLDEISHDETHVLLGPMSAQRLGGIKHTLHHLFLKPNPPTKKIISFLNIAVAVCSADKRFLRSATKDAWTRQIKLSIPVCKDFIGTEEIFEDCLRFLSGDYWSIEFRQEDIVFNTQCYYEPEFIPDAICLFSGGTDSLAGAINLLEDGQKVILVGHHDFSHTASVQKQVFSMLWQKYGLENVRLTQFEAKVLNAPENTTRARSLLFIAIGLAVASSFGEQTPLYIPENGFIGINVPLTSGRLGSYSTRTTHPYYFEKLYEILSTTGISHEISNPLKFMSKGEVFENCSNASLMQEIFPYTISCAHPTSGRWAGLKPGNCGYCFPCLIRRASANTVGIDMPSHYAYDAIGDPGIFKAGGAKAVNLQSVLIRINKYITNSTQPTIEVMKAGSFGKTNGGYDKYVTVFKNGIEELLSLIDDKGCSEIKKFAGL